MYSYVNGFMFSYDRGQVALIRKNRPNWQRGRLNGIGGKIEHNEVALDAMVREFCEETGYVTNPEDWRLCLCLKGKNEQGEDWQVMFYTSEGNLSLLYSTTDEEVVVVPTHSLPADTIRNLQWIIPFCSDSSKYTLPLFVEECAALA